MVTRRGFLKLGAIAGASLALPLRWLSAAPAARAYLSSGLSKFTQALRGVYPLDPNGIPVALPDGTRKWAKGKIVAQHYTIDINQFTDSLHPDLGPTTLRGYHSRVNLGGTPPQRHLGGIVVAQKGKPVQITFQNNLEGAHPLPVDTTIMGADMGPNRVSTHLHGGLVPWISDGGPFAWFDKDGNYGESAQKGGMNIFKVLNPNLQPGQGEYYYPNNQSARLVWYHDHAVGITRLNAYAGIATGYIIRDPFEGSLRNYGLPDFIENGGRELPLVIQDKIFVGENILSDDPTWSGVQTPGSLWYPHTYDPADFTTVPPFPPFPADPSIVPEMFGDTMLVNGVVHPFVQLEPRRYRLRILNACQARFLNLQLYEEIGESGQPDLTKKGPDFLVIGTEGGFLTTPALVPSNRQMTFMPDGSADIMNPGSLLTAPAERWDVIIDFKDYAGKNLILYNDAPAPFPMGDPAADHNDPGTGLNTRNIMRIIVQGSVSGAADQPLKITPFTPLAINPLSGVDPFWVLPWLSVTKGQVWLPKRATVRQLTLNEVWDDQGRLIQMLGTNQISPMPAGFTMDPAGPDYPNNYARRYVDDATEMPSNGAIEVWQIANLTGDTHPIHFHLVNVQLLARQSFTDASGAFLYSNGAPIYTAPARRPDATEMGWKETVKMHPGEVTTVMMRFDLPQVPFQVPESPRTGGHEYVWHCHILEHEEHDMMRPLIVT